MSNSFSELFVIEDTRQVDGFLPLPLLLGSLLGLDLWLILALLLLLLHRFLLLSLNRVVDLKRTLGLEFENLPSNRTNGFTVGLSHGTCGTMKEENDLCYYHWSCTNNNYLTLAGACNIHCPEVTSSQSRTIDFGAIYQPNFYEPVTRRKVSQQMSLLSMFHIDHVLASAHFLHPCRR